MTNRQLMQKYWPSQNNQYIIPQVPTIPGVPTLPLYDMNEKIILAQESPDGLLTLLDRDSQRQHEQRTNEMLRGTHADFMSIYASKASQEEFDKISECYTEFTPEQKSFWGRAIRGRGIRTTLIKRL